MYPSRGSSLTVGATYRQVTRTVDGLIGYTCTAVGGFCGLSLYVLSRNRSDSGPGPAELYAITRTQ